MEKKKINIRLRLMYAGAFVLLTAIEVLIALYVHDNFIRPYIGDVLVVIVVYCFVRIFIPRSLRLLPLYVFIFAVCVEILQYFDLVSVLGLSGNRLARVILGSVFDIKDIGCYAVGCLFLSLWEYKLRKNRTGKILL